jgi:Tfp pilus assembly protein PilO
MVNFDLIERNKNLIVNIAVVIVALFIAWHLHQSANQKIGLLVQQQGSELEKNKIVEEISALEQKSENYKNTFVKRDLSEIMDILTQVAKNSSVKILSVKPFAEEPNENYYNSSFLITLKEVSYHALGDFISKVENHKDIYLVSEINISSVSSQPSAPSDRNELGVILKINTISYL